MRFYLLSQILIMCVFDIDIDRSVFLKNVIVVYSRMYLALIFGNRYIILES